jgi:hypothetical protein
MYLKNDYSTRFLLVLNYGGSWKSYDWNRCIQKLNGVKFNTNQSFSVKPNRDGTSSRDIMTDITFDVLRWTLVFETGPIISV